MERSRLEFIIITMLYWLSDAFVNCWNLDIDDFGSFCKHQRYTRNTYASLASHRPTSILSLGGVGSGVSGASAGTNSNRDSRGGFPSIFSARQSDILYACPLNSMCQCVGFPNSSKILIEINCNEVELYKFPGNIKIFSTSTILHEYTFDN